LTALNSRLDGIQLSLPSEAQWEYACRARTETARYSENLDAIAWYRENSGNETHSVAGKEANSWGLYDMLGNVWEWCADVWVNDYTEKARASAAESASAHRVFRGGSWYSDARIVRAAFRYRLEPSNRLYDLGFRCAEFREGLVSGGEGRAGSASERLAGVRLLENLSHRLLEGRAESASERLAEPRVDRERLNPAPRAGEASSSAGSRRHEPDRCRQRRAKDADRGAQGGS
jgi:hypothetical protein